MSERQRGTLAYYDALFHTESQILSTLQGINLFSLSPNLYVNVHFQPIKDETQTALFKDPVRTAQ